MNKKRPAACLSFDWRELHNYLFPCPCTMSEGGRHWNYGGVEGPSTRSLIQDRESARKPRRVLSKNDFSEENRQLISDDEIHTDLTHYRNSQSASYYHGDTGTDVEMEYMASGSVDGISSSFFFSLPYAHFF